MADCVNPECRAVLPDDYAFCPFCGADNRPPESQKAVHDGEHVFPPTAEYCILCGEPRDEPYPSLRHVWRLRLAWSFIFLTILAGTFACLCAYVAFKLPADSHTVFADWCRAGSFLAGTDPARSTNGDIAMWSGAILVFTLGPVGVQLLLGLPIEHRSLRRQFWGFWFRDL